MPPNADSDTDDAPDHHPDLAPPPHAQRRTLRQPQTSSRRLSPPDLGAHVARHAPPAPAPHPTRPRKATAAATALSATTAGVGRGGGGGGSHAATTASAASMGGGSSGGGIGAHHTTADGRADFVRRQPDGNYLLGSGVGYGEPSVVMPAVGDEEAAEEARRQDDEELAGLARKYFVAGAHLEGRGTKKLYSDDVHQDMMLSLRNLVVEKLEGEKWMHEATDGM